MNLSIPVRRTYAGYVAALLVSAVHLSAAAAPPPPSEATVNAAVIAESFEKWTKGEGSMFDLLSDDARWTVAGVSPISTAYDSKHALVEQAVKPIHAQLSGSITPTVRHIVAQGNQVVVIWDGTATAKDGTAYNNSYAWHLTMTDGKVTEVLAFLDTWNLAKLMEKR